MKTSTAKTVRPVGYKVEYSYAGFEYSVSKSKDGWHATPLVGQHRASNKDKHKLAAVECYLAEYNEE